MELRTAKATARKILSIILLLSFFCTISFAEVLDKVVAYIDDEAITLSELEEEYASSIEVKPTLSKLQVLDTIINRRLLIREAKKLRFEAPDETTLLDEYVDIKVKALIKIRDSEMEEFYNNNRKEFEGVEFEGVKDRIELYLQEKEVNRRLKEHISELQKKSDIKIMLEPED
jgi:hypothetical protein